MGEVYADITLKNERDIVLAKEGYAAEQDIHSITVRALVDTGAVALIINEDVCKKLSLAIEGTRTATLADGSKVVCNITEPVRLYWKDRDYCGSAVVVPGGEVLLGVIPLEFMDLIVDPVAEQLIGAHGDRIVSRIL